MPKPKHELVLETDGNGELRVGFKCNAPADTGCRRRPKDPGLADWDSETEMDEGGHECWAEEWISAVGIEDAIRVVGPVGSDGTLARVPIEISYEDGVLVSPISD